MREIVLNRGFVAEVDAADFDRINSKKWTVDIVGRNVYACRCIGKCPSRKILMHREVLNLGSNDPKVDHRDSDGLNNQKSNLRLATNSQNNANQRVPVTNTSGFKGVHRMRNKWQAQIKVNGLKIHIGMFADKIEAARAYNTAALEHFGEFARLNNI